jgi:hypothetical protein
MHLHAKAVHKLYLIFPFEECLKEAKDLLQKFKDELGKAEKEATGGSVASTPPSSHTPGSVSQQEAASVSGLGSFGNVS